ncbi:MAG: aldose 1-epimerase family protein [Phycicoccus sp.]|nr:aldose 1-epimerase family protein [Phycicoccus sp.]NMM33833.1 aldose 1-epimerase family protein [Phycicoccus sp.]
MSVFPSGEQWTIRHGDHEAVVVEVGGGLRTYAFRGQDVLAGYSPDARCSAGRGQLLMPWPNRIRDGRYSFAGSEHQLALTEPDRGNAAHGLVRWASWSVLEQSEDTVTLGCRLRPQPGWEWSLDLSVTYALTASGLTVTPGARNVGADPAPFGFGAHPYLSVGEARVDEVVLGIPAASMLEVDARLLPTGLAPVDGTSHDFREPRVLGGLGLDTAFTDIAADADGRWRVTLTHPRTGQAVTLWADATAYPWLQVFTGDSLPRAHRRTSGIAVEPMTCPPDAFNSGDDLLVLQPGQAFAAPWGITPG